MSLEQSASSSVLRAPIKLTPTDLAGDRLKCPDVVSDGKLTHAIMGSSKDGKYSAGIFEASGGATEFESFPHDEFCYLLSGEAKLTNVDGTVLRVEAGEALFVPCGWKGRWSTPGFSKVFAIYQPEA